MKRIILTAVCAIMVIANCVAQTSEFNKVEKFNNYQKLANQGNAEAQCKLGYCYSNGEGVERSPEKAVFWFQKAAEQGFVGAQNALGMRYYLGDGVEKSPEKAAVWWKKAAEQGDTGAQLFLYGIYNNAYNNQYNNSSSNNSAILERIRQIEWQLEDAQRSLRKYEKWYKENPSVSGSMLINSQRNLIRTYQQQIQDLRIQLK